MASVITPPPQRSFDPWAPQPRRTAQWFVVSGLVHVGLLFLFATVTLTVIQKIEEVRVKVEEEAVPGEEVFEGADSLRDVAGALKPETALPQRAQAGSPSVQGVRAPELPSVGGFGPKIGGPVVDMAVPVSFGAGGGGIGGLGGRFGEYVGGLRKVGLDVVLVIDTTHSMQFVIDEVRGRLKEFVATLQRLVPTTRVGIVVFRDKGDDFVVKWTDLSFNTQKLLDFLSTIQAGGGGDWEEAVRDALDTAVHELKWRKQAKKVIILVGDAPPHPWEVDEVKRIAREFRQQGGYLSAIDVTQPSHEIFDRFMWRSLHGSQPYQPAPMPEHYKEVARVFGELAKLGGGEMTQLGNNKALMRTILELTFGSRWKTEMAKYIKELM